MSLAMDFVNGQVGFGGHAAMRADKAVRPAGALNSPLTKSVWLQSRPNIVFSGVTEHTMLCQISWAPLRQRAVKIGGARRVIGKLPLELRERLWKSQIVTLVDVHGGHDERILALVGVCVNRIGTGQPTNSSSLSFGQHYNVHVLMVGSDTTSRSPQPPLFQIHFFMENGKNSYFYSL